MATAKSTTPEPEEDVAVPTTVIPADHVTTSYVPEGEPVPGGFVAAHSDTGAIVKDVATTDAERAEVAEQAKADREKAEAEAAKSVEAEPAPSSSTSTPSV